MATQTKKLTTLAMLSALAYMVMVVGRIPVVLFLKYDPKDVIITIGGFLYGPIAAFAMSAIVSFVEMFTVSETGLIGLIMNILSSCAFACTAAVIYKKMHSIKGAIIGLISALIFTTIIMLLWNYFITPIYMGVPREAVAKMLISAFLPFNLIKGSLNAAITMLVYKPLVVALRQSRLIPISEESSHKSNKKITIGSVLLSLFVIATCILLILVLQGKI